MVMNMLKKLIEVILYNSVKRHSFAQFKWGSDMLTLTEPLNF